jgi:hypothetical protein
MTDAKLWKWFSIYIRVRDSDDNGNATCFTCGRVKKWKEGDCGHGIGRQHKSTKYNEMNNHFQCKKCNGFEEGRKDEYARKVDEIYGPGTWDKLLLASKQACKRGKVEIETMTEYYKKEAMRIAKLKNITL